MLFRIGEVFFPSISFPKIITHEIISCVMLILQLSFLFFSATYTHQFFKWKSVRKWYKKEKQAYEQSLQEQQQREFAGGKETRDSNNLPGEISDVDVGCTGPRGEVLISSSSSSVPNRSIEDPGQMPSNIYE
jgi:hypothetical protein